MAKKPSLSFHEFTVLKRRAKCRVCKLPEDVRKQFPGRHRGAKRKPATNSNLSYLLDWIHETCGVRISTAEYLNHARGGHEYAANHRRERRGNR